MELLAFLSPSPMEIAVIAVIALIVLGPSRLPEAARSLGKGLREMRDSFQGNDDASRFDDDDDEYDLALEEEPPEQGENEGEAKAEAPEQGRDDGEVEAGEPEPASTRT